MPLTKCFNELVQNRAANDLEFAAALREAAGTPPLTMRDALRQIWEADRYPILGNECVCGFEDERGSPCAGRGGGAGV